MKKLLQSRRATVLLFVLAAVLLLSGTIGGIRAAVLRQSPFYTASVGTSDIGVTLLENGKAIGWRDYGDGADGSWNERRGALLENLLAEGESFQLGKAYPETLCVQNSGAIDNYVRVSLYCYWQDEAGNKLQTLSPEYIRLGLVTGNGWVIDEASSTPERTVLYYTRVLAAGETTPPCCESLSVDNNVRYVSAEGIPLYNGAFFHVEVEVDAVQSHNAEAAIRSAWGRRVSVVDDVLQLS